MTCPIERREKRKDLLLAMIFHIPSASSCMEMRQRIFNRELLDRAADLRIPDSINTVLHRCFLLIKAQSVAFLTWNKTIVAKSRGEIGTR